MTLWLDYVQHVQCPVYTTAAIILYSVYINGYHKMHIGDIGFISCQYTMS